MKVLMVGTGGVGASAVQVARRRKFFDSWLVSDVDAARAQAAVEAARDDRFEALPAVDARDADGLAALIKERGVDALLNAVDPQFDPPLMEAAFQGGCTYLDMASTLSQPHPERPYEEPGVLLGSEQLAQHERWADAGRLAVAGIGVEPGLADVFARYARDHLFSEIDTVSVRDGANIEVKGYDFAPNFSIWTTIEECLNPPIIWERDRGWYTTEPFSEPETFVFPEGIGPVQCVNVEHEEVIFVPREIECNRVDFKYGLGDEFIETMKAIRRLGIGGTEPVRVGDVEVVPRALLAAVLPDPATLGDLMSGLTCAGTLVSGKGTDGKPRSTYLYHVVDNAWAMREYGSQAVVLQTALNPVIALELVAEGAWSGAGVRVPESFEADPFLAKLAEYGAPHAVEER